MLSLTACLFLAKTFKKNSSRNGMLGHRVRDMGDEALKAAETMRRYIVEHLTEDILPVDAASAAGYSLRHGSRLFRLVTGKSLGEYIRLLRLSSAAQSLAENTDNVLGVALSHRYDSHEGFTKAFTSAFGITPRSYRKGGRPIQYFIPYPIATPEIMFRRKDGPMNKNIITASFVPRPVRKLILMHSNTGVDYWSYCREKGCDWEGLLLSIRERMDSPAFLSLPPAMIPKGCAEGAVGIEVPQNYTGEIPEGYVLADLPAGEMLYFQSQPYEPEDAFPEAIQSVFDAYEHYDAAIYGYAFDTNRLPVFNFGAFPDKGARIAVPVKKA